MCWLEVRDSAGGAEGGTHSCLSHLASRVEEAGENYLLGWRCCPSKWGFGEGPEEQLASRTLGIQLNPQALSSVLGQLSDRLGAQTQPPPTPARALLTLKSLLRPQDQVAGELAMY